MPETYAWGLSLVKALQVHASPALTLAMNILSLSGTEYCFLVLLPLFYWCVDKRRGLRIGTLVFLSTVINLRLKLVFAQPRPYDLDASVAMAREVTFGLPSDHAQTSVVLWGSAAPLFRAPWGLVLAIALPLLVGISRVYLGVHFPTDVLAGWAIGAVILGLDRLAGDRIESFVLGLRDKMALALTAAAALAMNFVYIQDTAMSGAFFGFVGAALWERHNARFSVSGSLGKRTARLLFGLATLAIVYALPKLLLAGIEAGGPPLVHFLRYVLVGAWASAGAPWLFLKLGLASAEEDHSAGENEGSVISK
jgi:membrane-associated phospholipid phosphatase